MQATAVLLALFQTMYGNVDKISLASSLEAMLSLLVGDTLVAHQKQILSDREGEF
jgi:hypothetical protein